MNSFLGVQAATASLSDVGGRDPISERGCLDAVATLGAHASEPAVSARQRNALAGYDQLQGGEVELSGTGSGRRRHRDWPGA